jgi:hypothetical protein
MEKSMHRSLLSRSALVLMLSAIILTAAVGSSFAYKHNVLMGWPESDEDENSVMQGHSQPRAQGDAVAPEVVGAVRNDEFRIEVAWWIRLMAETVKICWLR